MVAYRLITEGEHQLLRSARDRSDGPHPGEHHDTCGKAASSLCANPDAVMLCGGADIEARCGFNLQLAHSSQNPVTELPASDKGFHDVMGNAWEWAEDHYSAFPGFKVHHFYEDFSSPCFAGKHQLILGGSFISTGQLGSKFARYQFRPHFFQHASFRIVAQSVDRSIYDMARYGRDNPLQPFYKTSCMDCAPPYVGDGPCCSVHRRAVFTPTVVEGREQGQAKQDATQLAFETDDALSQYLAMHYGPAERVYGRELLAESGLLQASLDLPRTAAEQLCTWAARAGVTVPSARALDLGCAVGRSTFALAREFGEVIGIDISARFIEVATKLREHRALAYDLRVEGEITERVMATLDDDVDTARVRFVQGDACHLPHHAGAFDAVLAAGLLDCVPDPGVLLKTIASVLRPGGVALLSTSFSWDDARTPRANWLGGTLRDGEPVRGPDALAEAVAPDFTVLSEGSAPLLLASHARAFSLSLMHTVVLQRR
ncbi:hypothetical protein FOA52_011832 [Chlamydomonas sp. UWO 241]|nr:hypothetical protein FOA52_011832 [Chlamydomonas sp. UWO 241]